MRILITHRALAQRAGSELYVRDLAAALLDRGHTPIVYSPRPGDVAEELRALTIPVVDALARVAEAPDLIHGQHRLETVEALLHFPGIPCVYFCHGWLPWAELPPRLPRILRWVAVDDTVRDRLVLENGLAPDRVEVLPNFVDLKRFRRRPALPSRPQRALVFSNSAAQDTFVPEIERACRAEGIALEVLGRRSGRATSSPESMLGGFDLVFAKARAAFEAMATGAAVILCDRAGSGPLVTSEAFPELRRLNFGIRALRAPITADALRAQIRRYDALDAARVCSLVRSMHALDTTVDAIVNLYEEVVADFQASKQPSIQEEGRAAAAYVRSWAPLLEKLESIQRREGRKRLRRRWWKRGRPER